jgi:4-hydroxybenzoate polyprenyltransferase
MSQLEQREHAQQPQAPAEAPASLISRISAFWQLSRPRTCMVGLLAYVFGVEATGGAWSAHALAGLLFVALVPAVANVHNAYTDLAEDAGNMPGRLKLVKAATVPGLKWFVKGGIAAMFASCLYMGLWQLVIGIVAVLLLLSYSAGPIRAKGRPFGGLLIFSMVVSEPFLMGATVGDEWLAFRSPLVPEAWVWLLWLTAMFYAKGFVKNVPDYDGDLAAGVRTSATVVGSRDRAARLAALAVFVAYACLPLAVWASGGSAWLYLAAAWGVVVAWHATRMVREQDTARLNTILQQDMVLAVATLSILAIAARGGSIAAYAVVGCCWVVLVVTDLIGKDSRSPEHQQASSQH